MKKPFLFLRVAFVVGALSLTTSCADYDKECVKRILAEMAGKIVTDYLPAQLFAGEVYLIPCLIKNGFDAAGRIVEDCSTIGRAGQSRTRMVVEYDDLDPSNGSGFTQTMVDTFFVESPLDAYGQRLYNDKYLFDRPGMYRISGTVDQTDVVDELDYVGNRFNDKDIAHPRSSSTADGIVIKVVLKNPADLAQLEKLPPVQVEFAKR